MQVIFRAEFPIRQSNVSNICTIRVRPSWLVRLPHPRSTRKCGQNVGRGNRSSQSVRWGTYFARETASLSIDIFDKLCNRFRIPQAEEFRERL